MSQKYKFLNQEGLYFVSFSTVFWIDVFTRTEYRDILISSFKFCQKEKDLNIYAYCIMTNHVHLIISTRERPLSDIFRDMKQFTAKRILKAIDENPQESRKKWMLNSFGYAGRNNSSNEIYQFWQHSNHPIEITDAKMMRQKLDYIHDNPVVAGFVQYPQDWLYSSAKNYLTDELPVLEVILLE